MAEHIVRGEAQRRRQEREGRRRGAEQKIAAEEAMMRRLKREKCREWEMRDRVERTERRVRVIEERKADQRRRAEGNRRPPAPLIL
jgi:hypothetical protein